MPRIRVSVADLEVRLSGPDLPELLAAAQLLIPLLAAVERDQIDDPEERPPIGFTTHTELDPDRQRLTDPVWFDDEE